MFSLRSLLVIVAVAALGTAALVYATPYWASAAVTLTLCIFGFGLLRICSDSEKRRFWVPVSVLGWFYLALAFAQPTLFYSELVTSRLIYDLWYTFGGDERLIDYGDGTKEFWYHIVIMDLSDVAVSNLGLPNDYEVLFEFRRIYMVAQSLIALALAFGGGAIYSWSVNRKKHGA